MKKIAVITIHGMGETEKGYATEFGEDLADRVGNKTWKNDVHFSQIYFQDKLQLNQQNVWKRTKKEVDWKKLRKFLLYSVSDAASLEVKKDDTNSKYTQVQKIILETFKEAYKALGNKARPVVFVGYSLGCQVMSNYIWDASRTNGAYAGIWKNQPPGINPASPLNRFVRGRTIKRLFTCGCNIPIFVAGHDVIKPISKPNNEFEWHNYYDEDDVLGWPLRPLSDGYRKLVKDHEINVGGRWYQVPFQSWNPLSHTAYWQDSDFIAPVSSFIRKAL